LFQQPGGDSPPLFQFRRRSFGPHAKDIGITIPLTLAPRRAINEQNEIERDVHYRARHYVSKLKGVRANRIAITFCVVALPFASMFESLCILGLIPLLFGSFSLLRNTGC
jgi:hypothetical protein